MLCYIQALIESQALEVMTVIDRWTKSSGSTETRTGEKHFFSPSLSCPALCFYLKINAIYVSTIFVFIFLNSQ